MEKYKGKPFCWCCSIWNSKKNSSISSLLLVYMFFIYCSNSILHLFVTFNHILSWIYLSYIIIMSSKVFHKIVPYQFEIICLPLTDISAHGIIVHLHYYYDVFAFIHSFRRPGSVGLELWPHQLQAMTLSASFGTFINLNPLHCQPQPRGMAVSQPPACKHAFIKLLKHANIS